MTPQEGRDARTMLGVSAEATDEDVRKAYKRLRAVYASEATYGLLAPDEINQFRDAIDAAYAVLMDPERRARLRPDATPTPPIGSLTLPAGFLAGVAGPPTPTPNPAAAAPLRAAARDEGFEEFQASATGEGGGATAAGGAADSDAAAGADRADEQNLAREVGAERGTPSAVPSGSGVSAAAGGGARAAAGPFDLLGASGEALDGSGSAPVALAGPFGGGGVTATPAHATPPAPGAAAHARLDLELRPDMPLTGELLRRVREARNVDLRDVSHHTKVSVTQLHAIENEAFQALPAAVYVRGFVVEYARYLRFPDPQAAARSYLERYRAFLDARGS
jgi:hypothetical protein